MLADSSVIFQDIAGNKFTETQWGMPFARRYISDIFNQADSYELKPIRHERGGS